MSDFTFPPGTRYGRRTTVAWCFYTVDSYGDVQVDKIDGQPWFYTTKQAGISAAARVGYAVLQDGTVVDTRAEMRLAA
jgi:hypothetical protein